MASRIFLKLGNKSKELWDSFVLFFQYTGEITYNFLLNYRSIGWHDTLVATLRSGTWIVIPLVIATSLMGISLAVTINHLLAPYNLQDEALFAAQRLVLLDFTPIPIGIVLCVQCGLNLIDVNHPSLHHPPQKVVLETIIPLMVSISFTALLLYTYISISFFVSMFFAYNHLLKVHIDEYLLRLSGTIKPADFLFSLFKTICYATIASFTAGYYYYDVAQRIIPIRKAVSRIITRGLFWLIVVSVALKVLTV
ncbi:ABC transporter permease [Legionella dresdenensis]|uniref:ABC transporter permease n=1 Tax=Legionella dresdenensis TaxID=450200 RepID=A0ABV8CFU2_9GAMM